MSNNSKTIISLKYILITVIAAFTFWGTNLSAQQFDTSYSPVVNSDAEDCLNSWTFESAKIVKSGKKGKCFLLGGSSQEASICSEPVSIRKNEAVQLQFDIMTVKSSTPCTAEIISYSYDKKTVLSNATFKCKLSNSWSPQIFNCRVDKNAYYVAVKFSMPAAGSKAKTYIDNIFLAREISFNPLYGDIKPMTPGTTLYTYRKGSRRNNLQAIAIGSLQGTTARVTGPHIWLDSGDDTHLDNFSQNYGIKIDRKYENNFVGLIKEMKPYTSGQYVLYDINDSPSLSAANTLAGLVDGMAIDIKIENLAKASGYTMALDARGKDCRWVYENYRDQLNYDGIVIHTNDYKIHPSVDCLIDWSPATKSICWWLADDKYSREVYRSMSPCSPAFGWQDPTTDDEGLTVKIHSEEGLFQMPSDWMTNLSVHASFGPMLKDKQFKQKLERKEPPTEDNVHYVTIVMSDMDNILTEIGTNSFYSNKRYFANDHRGEFPMSWGMAPSLVELSPTAVELWYNAATKTDAFVGYCGLGYFYPNVAPYLQSHMQRLEGFIKRADLKTMLLIDRVLPDNKFSGEYYKPYAEYFMNLEQIHGLYYMEYVEYAPHGGKIYWYNNKPMVTARFDYRNEEFYSAVRSTPEKLADTLNALPRDPHDPDSYSMVTVHAWSKGMDDIAEAVKLLDENVKVVNAEEFIELLRKNIPANKRK